MTSIAFTLDSRPLFLLYGDSITQLGSKTEPLGWVAKLQEAYSANYRVADVLNRGYSGYNTRWALLQLPYLIAQTSCAPSICTLFFGANDSAATASKQHVPLEEYVENLDKMVVVWDAGRGGPGCGMRELERARLYAEAVVSLAARIQCTCVDLFTHIHTKAEWKSCLSDGLHLSSAGNEALYQCVCKAIESGAPDLMPERLPVHFPLWSALAQADTAAALIPAISEAADGNGESLSRKRAKFAK